MEKYKISIVLPCYHVASYIDAAVQSILRQTYKDYEVIFINDGSAEDKKGGYDRACRSLISTILFYFNLYFVM